MRRTRKRGGRRVIRTHASAGDDQNAPRLVDEAGGSIDGGDGVRPHPRHAVQDHFHQLRGGHAIEIVLAVSAGFESLELPRRGAQLHQYAQTGLAQPLLVLQELQGPI